MFIYSKVKIKYKRKDKENIKIKKTKTKRQSANQATIPKFLLLFLLFFYSEVNSTALPPLPKPFLFILNLMPRRDHPSTFQRCNLIGSLLYLEVGGRRSAVGGRLSAIGYRLLTVGYRLLAVGYRLSAVGYRLSAVGYYYLRLGLTNHWSLSSTRRSVALPDIHL